MPILETSRLALREFVPEDRDALAKVISDPETMRHYPNRFGPAEVDAWIARNRARCRDDGFGLWAMILKETGELIGDCGLILQQVDGLDEVEIGYHVRRDLWGKGYASEAASACRDYGFANLPVQRLISLIRPENLQSRRVAEKVGMQLWKETLRRGLPHCVYAMQRVALPPGQKKKAG